MAFSVLDLYQVVCFGNGRMWVAFRLHKKRPGYFMARSSGYLEERKAD